MMYYPGRRRRRRLPGLRIYPIIVSGYGESRHRDQLGLGEHGGIHVAAKAVAGEAEVITVAIGAERAVRFYR
jgi:hypothetical protein